MGPVTWVRIHWSHGASPASGLAPTSPSPAPTTSPSSEPAMCGARIGRREASGRDGPRSVGTSRRCRRIGAQRRRWMVRTSADRPRSKTSPTASSGRSSVRSTASTPPWRRPSRSTQRKIAAAARAVHVLDPQLHAPDVLLESSEREEEVPLAELPETGIARRGDGFGARASSAAGTGRRAPGLPEEKSMDSLGRADGRRRMSISPGVRATWRVFPDGPGTLQVPTEGANAMQYIVLIYGSEKGWSSMSKPERRADVRGVPEVQRGPGEGRGHPRRKRAEAHQHRHHGARARRQAAGDRRARSPRPRSSSAASTSSTSPTSRRPWTGRRSARRPRDGSIEVRPLAPDGRGRSQRCRSMLARAIDQLVRREGPRVLAGLIRWSGDFDLAEEAFQARLCPGAGGLARPRAPPASGRVAHHRGPSSRGRSHAPPPARRAARARAARCARAGARRNRWVGARGRGRPAAAAVHRVPSGAGPAAQIALALRTLCGLTTAGDRPRAPRAGGDHRPATGPGEAEDRRGAHPLRGALRRIGWPSGSTESSPPSTWSSTRASRRPRASRGSAPTCAPRPFASGAWWWSSSPARPRRRVCSR